MVTRKLVNITLAALLLNWLGRGKCSECLCRLSDLLFLIMSLHYWLIYILLLLVLCLTVTLLLCRSAINITHRGTTKVPSYAAASSGRLCGMPKAVDRYHGVTDEVRWTVNLFITSFMSPVQLRWTGKTDFNLYQFWGQFNDCTAICRLISSNYVVFFWRTGNYLPQIRYSHANESSEL